MTNARFSDRKNMSFDTLVDMYYDKTFSNALRKTQTREEAEDLCQETFSRAYRFFDSYNKEIPFEAWLNKIMTNKNIDIHRMSFEEKFPNMSLISIDRPIDMGDRPVYTEIPDYSSDPLFHLEREYERESMKKAISMLKPGFRDVLILADFEEKTYEEIAEILGIEVGTVRSRLHRARNMIKRILENS